MSKTLVGETLGGRYRVLRLIGEGQMAWVYEAEQLSIARRIAIKTLRPELIKEASAVARFHREVQAVALLRSPHTIEFYDYGEAPGGQLFIALELLTGETLQDRLRDRRVLPAAEVLAIVRQIAWSLDEAHWAQVVHRDLKPANVFICDLPTPITPFVKVLDFGFAKLLQSDDGVVLTGKKQVVGTPAYIAPETAVVGRASDTRVDIYALGVMAFEMLVGERPFQAGSALEMLIAHAREPIPSILGRGVDLPPAVDAVMANALAKDPDNRYQTGAQLTAALEAALAGE